MHGYKKSVRSFFFFVVVVVVVVVSVHVIFNKTRRGPCFELSQTCQNHVLKHVICSYSKLCKKLKNNK